MNCSVVVSSTIDRFGPSVLSRASLLPRFPLNEVSMLLSAGLRIQGPMLAGVHWLRRYRLQSRAKWKRPRIIVYRRGAARDRGKGSRRLAERVVARKARSNDVCLVLKETFRVRDRRYGFWHGDDE